MATAGSTVTQQSGGGDAGPAQASTGGAPTLPARKENEGVHQHMHDVAAAEPGITHISTLSFFVVDERPDANTPMRATFAGADMAQPQGATTPFRSMPPPTPLRGSAVGGAGVAGAGVVRTGLPATPARPPSSSTPGFMLRSGEASRRYAPTLSSVHSVAAANGRNLFCLAVELHMRSSCHERLRRTAAMHLDMSVRRDQVLGVYPEKLYIGTQRYYLARLVGDHYILDTFVHENDIEDRFDYTPPPGPEGHLVDRKHFPTSDKSYTALFCSNTTGDGLMGFTVFDYCCLVTLDGERLPFGKYRLPSALQACTIACGHEKPPNLPELFPVGNDMFDDDYESNAQSSHDHPVSSTATPLTTKTLKVQQAMLAQLQQQQQQPPQQSQPSTSVAGSCIR